MTNDFIPRLSESGFFLSETTDEPFPFICGTTTSEPQDDNPLETQETGYEPYPFNCGATPSEPIPFICGTPIDEPDTSNATVPAVVSASPAVAQFLSSRGRDIFKGTGASDIFLFGSAKSAGLGKKSDVIFNFEHGHDDIDLSGIDAKSGSRKDDAFRSLLSGDKAFTKAGQLRYDAKTGILSGNTDNDAQAEFQIVLKNKPLKLSLDDFIL